VIVLDGNLKSFDLGTFQVQPLSQFPKGAYAASPALSHDRKLIAYTYYVIPKDPKDLGGSDLYVSEASGANPRILRPHPEAGATYEDPCWTADGKAVLATLRKPIFDQGQYTGEALAIMRVGLDGSEPTVLVKDALGPATSPDGKYLAYTAVDSKGQLAGLYVGAPDAKSMVQILGDQGFAILRFPTFSPDSSRLAFSAVGGPGAAIPSIKVGWLPPGFGVAEAHGIPWDIWTVSPDGTKLQRLTHESEDTPIPTWSPNGEWIAFAGEIGLYLVDSGGKQTMRISTIVSGGGVVWPI
jgi:Tol biopolymer transport system component